MKVAVAQFAPRLGELNFNLQQIRALHQQAAEAGADLAVFPELSLSGYWLTPPSSRYALSAAHPVYSELLELSRSLPFVLGYAERSQRGRIYNSATLFQDAQALHTHRKLKLPTYGRWEEQKHFSKGQTLRVFDFAGWRVALFICYDFWFPSLVHLAAADDADLIIVVANSSLDAAGYNKRTWTLLEQISAAIYGTYVIFCNRVGEEAGDTFWGGSAIVKPGGEVLQRAGSEVTIIYGELQHAEIAALREQMPIMRDDDLDFNLHQMRRIREQRQHEND